MTHFQVFYSLLLEISFSSGNLSHFLTNFAGSNFDYYGGEL